MDAAELMRRLQDSDPTALAELCDQLAPTALAVASGLCVDDAHAEQVVRDAFVLVWRLRAEYDADRGRVRAWVLGILRLRAVVTRPEAAPAPAAAQRAQGVRLRELLDALPRTQREIVLLAAPGGLTVAEIARELDLPAASVAERMHRGLTTLALHVAPH
jgi:RNA polymerase sigma-70 factor (ECF subfamily)